MKKCTICKESKPLAEFNKKKSKPDGLQPACRECSHKAFKAYYVRSREKHLIEVKLRSKKVKSLNWQKLFDYLADKACTDCFTSDVRILEFDHLRDKKYNVSQLMAYGYSWNTIIKEIEKCDIVCSNCHRIRTHERNNSKRFKLYNASLRKLAS